MKKSTICTAIATVLILGAMGSAQAADLRKAQRPVEGQYIVVLKNTAARLA